MSKLVAAFPLPVTVEALDAMYRLKIPPMNLNDEVHRVYRQLWPEEKFRLLLDAVGDEDAIEGKTDVDDVCAAIMIRDFARNDGFSNYVAGKPLAAIVRSLRVVMRRHQMGRDERSTIISDPPSPPTPASAE